MFYRAMTNMSHILYVFYHAIKDVINNSLKKIILEKPDDLQYWERRLGYFSLACKMNYPRPPLTLK